MMRQLPQGWEIHKLGDKKVADIIMGQSPESSSYNSTGEGLPFYQGKKDFGKIYPTPTEYCSEPKKIAHPNDILLSVRAPVGATNIANEKCCIGRGLAAIRANPSMTSTGFIRYFLMLNEQKISDRSRGSTFASINKSDVEELALAFPPLPQQEKIVSVLDTASALVEKQKALLKKYDLFLKSKFIEMFGDPVKNPMGWEINKLGKSIKIIGGAAFKSSDYTDEGIPLIKIGTINKGYFDYSNLSYLPKTFLTQYQKYLLNPNDLLLTLTGTAGKDDYGNAYILQADFNQYLLNQRVAKLELKDNINNIFLYYYLKDKNIKGALIGLDRGVRQGNISNKDIEEILMYLPPKELQTQFAQIVEQTESLKQKEQLKFEKLQTLYDALMKRAFDGEIE